MKILLSAFAFGIGLSVGAQAQPPLKPLPAPKISRAIDGVLAAFQTHPLVGLGNDEGGDNHSLAQQADFYAALVRDPRFARQVGNAVVEFGSASDQGIIDRYVNGEEVPYTDLRKVWSDPVGWYVPPPIDLGYVNFFAQVRAVNASLPAGQRIHVWLGDPPVNWANAKSRKDVVPPSGWQFRENHAANLIEREILAKNRKALVIYGTSHFLRDPVLLETIPGYTSMAALVEKKYPGAIFSIFTYVGMFADKGCAAAFEKDKQRLALPALLMPVRGTNLADPAFAKKCPPPGHWNTLPGASKDKQADVAQRGIDEVTGLHDDAMLYLGPASSLTSSPVMPDAYLDTGYLKEMQRRWKIMGAKNATPDNTGITVEKNSVSPQPFKP